ncbi:MAG: N-acetyltransferase [Candidatus Eremiobacteraeota bacterium]|nr:N-acetyltransferase [Candidatus Eremiobacteraeota bacterium]
MAARLETFLPAQPADESWRIVDGEQTLAACSLWWRTTPSLDGVRSGLIGHYETTDDRAAGRLLAYACARLSEQGCAVAIGPMDGSTWHSYRFVTERGTEPAFFLEPQNPDEWPAQFQRAGFAPLAHYVSALDAGLELRDERAPSIEAQLRASGVTIRPIDAGRFEDEVRGIFAVSLDSFARNLLYQPIGEAEFLEMYRPLARYVDPRLSFVAQRDGRMVGFVFTLPDWSARPGTPKAVIVKTLARLGDGAYRGLGVALLERSRRAAHEAGFARGIHALMHDANPSTRLSARFGAIMRGYTLFSKAL